MDHSEETHPLCVSRDDPRGAALNSAEGARHPSEAPSGNEYQPESGLADDDGETFGCHSAPPHEDAKAYDCPRRHDPTAGAEFSPGSPVTTSTTPSLSSRTSSDDETDDEASPSASFVRTSRNRKSKRAGPATTRSASSLLEAKPFRCPNALCNKSYKQANGLRYHILHGSCTFGISKEYKAVQDFRLERGFADEDELSASDIREVERRVRPFACGVGSCLRRYKNANGLKYHYEHTGRHGIEGLRLLASSRRHRSCTLPARA